MRLADFLIKPVSPVDLVRTCARVATPSASSETSEDEILTFLPAVGGAGVTTLAVQSAMMLLHSGQRGKASTCLVDLDFQHGACADYLDLEPRLDLGEIEPRPERLDRQLLEVMLSHHPSGLAVIAAPNSPAEMRSFDPEMVTRLLDLVSSHFDHVVFDMPRTWFSWTDSVLLGSNTLFIVSEMTVPGLKHAKQLVEAVRERLAEGPQPRVIINRYEQKLFSSGLRKGEGVGSRIRRLHSQSLRAGARSDRSWGAARRSEARQQDHGAAQKAHPAATGHEAGSIFGLGVAQTALLGPRTRLTAGVRRVGKGARTTTCATNKSFRARRAHAVGRNGGHAKERAFAHPTAH
jgi:MinD-like ATPase involved in chromosome partitioning or flagellar assembly